MTNPLLNLTLHPDYPLIKAEHIEPAILAHLEHAKKQLEALSGKPVSLGWEAIITPLDEALDALSRCWAVVGHLNAVMDHAAWRKAFNKMLPLVTDFYTALEQSQALLHCCQQLQQQMPQPVLPDLNLQRHRSLELAIQDFRLAGAELPADRRQTLAEMIKLLSEKGQQFSEHVLDAMNAGCYYLEESSRLAGLPEDVIEAAKQSAQEEGHQGWRFTPHMPSYLPVMQYAHDRRLREQMYRMVSTLASDQGDARFDNGPLMQEILTLRQESARLLGFADFVAMSLKPKMAQSSEAVKAFLYDLLERVKPQAQREFAALTAFAAKQLGIDKVEACGRSYVAFAAEFPVRFEALALFEAHLPNIDQDPGYMACLTASDAVQRTLVAAIEVGQRDGSIRAEAGAAGLIGFTLWGLMHGLIQIGSHKSGHLERDGISPQDLIENGFRLALQGLSPTGASR
ncbi:MAG: hypothetical protein EBV68_11555 [Betaproteobacteria bacterium]|nr:hypothetical protein [Betaproteobacteria bacterium]